MLAQTDSSSGSNRRNHVTLPKALFLAFTGTPLIATEERTKEVFGDYVSIYDFQQSVEDGATVAEITKNVESA